MGSVFLSKGPLWPADFHFAVCSILITNLREYEVSTKTIDLICTYCQHVTPLPDTPPLPDRCPQCGEDIFEARYDLDALRDDWVDQLRERQPNIWRYHELLPLRNMANAISEI